MSESIRFTSETLNKISEDYISYKSSGKEIEVVVDRYRDIDPLIIIRALSKGTPDVAELCNIAELLFDGSTIEFWQGETKLKGIVYARNNGNNKLSLVLDTYQLDRLLDVTYAILLKKSTPQ